MEKMLELKVKLDDLLWILDLDKQYIYLDYPIHFNKGDLAIYHWTEAFFLENKINILERFNIHNISYKRIHKLIEKHSNIVFLWHWWWNMWDTYLEKAEKKRRNFINEFSDQEIIFLPQSIHYKDDRNLEESIQYYNNENITLTVRDDFSFDLIKAKYPKANHLLIPDMAHYLTWWLFLDSFIKKSGTSKNTLVISRIDEEKKDKTIDDKTWVDITDWLLMTSMLENFRWYSLAWSMKLLSFFWLNPQFLVKKWHAVSLSSLWKWFDLLKDYKLIITDRLHWFIMSSLIWKTVETSDNYYGKIARYKETRF